MANIRFRKKKTTKKTESKKTESKKMGKIKHIKTEIDGIIFDSKMESQYYEYLKELKAAGIVTQFKLQPEFLLQEKFIIIEGQVIEGSNPDFLKLKRKYKVPTTQAIKYKSDFEVHYADGHVEIIDTKGIETADFKIKKKMFAYKYPTLDFRVIIKTKEGWVPYDEYQKTKRRKKKEKVAA